MRRYIAIYLCCATFICYSTLLAGRAVAQTPDGSVGAALRSLASRAGVAFVGRVTGVTHHDGVVEVRFAVEQTVLGESGATYTLREWAGLWADGQPRYQTGQRALFFLHALNAAGLSTPIDGMDGIVPLVPTSADAPPLLDVRRLAARVQRVLGARIASEDDGAVRLSDAAGVVSAWRSSPHEPARLPLRPITVHPPESLHASR